MRQFLITLVVVLTFTRATCAQCVSAPSGLQMHWTFNSSVEETVFDMTTDSVGSISFVLGTVSNAGSFDGASYLRVPAKPLANLGAGDGLTIEAWINPAQVESQHPLVEWHNGNGLVGVHFWVAVDRGAGGRGTLYANLVDANAVSHAIVSDLDAVAANTWQHVAVTYDKASGIARLFVNGAVVHESNIGSLQLQTAYDLYVGNRTYQGQNINYQGLIDELSFYSRALSSQEIGRINAAGAAGKCVSPYRLELAIQAVPKLTWNSHPGVSYEIQRAPRLAPDAWTTLRTFMATESVSTYIDAEINENLYVYRIELAP